MLDIVIQHVTGDVYHHQSQGMAKLMHRTLGERIKLYTSGRKTSKWDEEIDKLVLGINWAPHKVTKFSPFYLLHGYHARRKIDSELKIEKAPGEIFGDREIARERLEKAQLETCNDLDLEV